MQNTARQEKHKLEDFEVGETLVSNPFSFSEQEIIDFSKTYDPQFFHTDPQAAKQSYFGGLIASGWATGAMCLNALFQTHFLLPGGIIGIGVDRMRWYEPVRPNDQLQTHARISERRRSNSRAGWGIMTVEIEVKNQHARPVLTMTTTVMVEA